MRNLLLCSVLLGSLASAQQSPDANAIVVTAAKTVVLAPSDVSFMITVSTDIATPLEQVLAAVDFGLTMNDLVGVNSYPIAPPYGPRPDFTRINYMFRLTVPFARVKETTDKLEKLRKATDTGMDLTYSTAAIGPNAAAIDDAHDRALADLMTDARKRAQALANAAQLKLGNIQGVTESYVYTGTPYAPAQPIVTFSAVVRFGAQ